MSESHAPIVKNCKSCGKMAPHSWVKSMRTYRPRCKFCHNAYNRTYQQNSPSWKTKHNLYKSRFNKRLKQELVAMLGGKCTVCGLQDECMAVYDFHHTDPSKKDFSINQVGSRKAALREIQKCVLVCATCHRRIHAQLRQKNEPQYLSDY